MAAYNVMLIGSVEEFYKRIRVDITGGKRYFTVKLLKDRVTQEYEGTVYFEISADIKDVEIDQVIFNHLDPVYRYVGLYQIFEVPNKI